MRFVGHEHFGLGLQFLSSSPRTDQAFKFDLFELADSSMTEPAPFACIK